MCNLYRLSKPGHEVAHPFDALVGILGNAAPGEVYPGRPGMVVACNAEGARELRSMAWGFPLVLKGKNGQPLKPKPVNNARADKLDGFMWRYSFAERRCLIPLSAFAEAEGEKGAKTRLIQPAPGRLPRGGVRRRRPVARHARMGRLDGWPTGCRGSAVPALSGADGGGADGEALGSAVMALLLCVP
jgi:hypothetical protein